MQKEGTVFISLKATNQITFSCPHCLSKNFSSYEIKAQSFVCSNCRKSLSFVEGIESVWLKSNLEEGVWFLIIRDKQGITCGVVFDNKKVKPITWSVQIGPSYDYLYGAITRIGLSASVTNKVSTSIPAKNGSIKLFSCYGRCSVQVCNSAWREVVSGIQRVMFVSFAKGTKEFSVCSDLLVACVSDAITSL